MRTCRLRVFRTHFEQSNGIDERDGRAPLFPRALFDAFCCELSREHRNASDGGSVRVHTRQLDVRTMELQTTQEERISAPEVEHACALWDVVNDARQEQRVCSTHR